MLAPHDQRYLGVRLQVHEAVHHLGAGAFEVPCPANIGFLVESRLEFDDRGDRLAGLRRLDQRLDNRRTFTRAIKRLLDRDHGPVLCGLVQELHDDIEALVRVMDDDVLGPDGVETVAAEVADALREAWREGLEEKVRPVVDDQLPQIREAEFPIDGGDVVGVDAQTVHQQAAQFAGHGPVDNEIDDAAPPALFQGALEVTDQILGFLVDLDLAVANDAEEPELQETEARKQAFEMHAHGLFQWQEPVALARGQADEAVGLLGQADNGVDRLVEPEAVKLENQSEPEIGDERERVGRVDGHRRQQGQDLVVEPFGQPLPFASRKVALLDDRDALVAEFAAQLRPCGVLVADQSAGPPLDLAKLLRRCQAIDAGRRHAGIDLRLESGDPDHLELVEVVRRDRQETQTFQEWMAAVAGLFQHPGVERQPAQLAIDVSLAGRASLWRRPPAGVIGDRTFRNRVEMLDCHVDSHGPCSCGILFQ